MSAAGRASAAGCRVAEASGGLDRGWGLCLDDPPAKDIIDFPLVPPGVLYDVSHQCRLQYGAYSAFCDDMDNVCHTLWCSVGTTCHSKLDAAVDGTRCGENKWCLNGECVPVGFQPEAVDGGWSGWSAWSICSRSCGVGVQSAERQCTQPVPKYKGKYCVGERKRFRLCNLQACPAGRPSFRHIQCSHFDAMLYKGQLHTWVPVVNDDSYQPSWSLQPAMDVCHGGVFLVASITPALVVADGSSTWPPVNPCELHCRPSNEYFAEKLRDAVVDGTPCYQGRVSRDLCINGICKAKPLPGLLALETPPSQGLPLLISLDAVPVLPQLGNQSPGRDLTSCQLADPRQCLLLTLAGPQGWGHRGLAASTTALPSLNVGCDFEIDSSAMEDRCGVCHGNGSTCHTVSGTFEEAEGLGYVDVGLIPAGAREIRIQEVAEAANFLALRSQDPKKYFLNGGWTIQWDGDYQVAGTTFTYTRRGNWENLTSPGPTNEPVWIQLLFQESNPGVRYEYTVHREADGHGEVPPPEFSWHYGPWSKCTVTCGTVSPHPSVSPDPWVSPHPLVSLLAPWSPLPLSFPPISPLLGLPLLVPLSPPAPWSPPAPLCPPAPQSPLSHASQSPLAPGSPLAASGSPPPLSLPPISPLLVSPCSSVSPDAPSSPPSPSVSRSFSPPLSPQSFHR
ncbi:A disintegrin and metalloproteinase with thrombospondin motifs 7 [Saguinus oedipus]|uniref:A disintegrin and metalloproteinase with thrombospondin motifs 7 n=1 Tax=Saguinus oedipus TaxID=9490 RepID=A0ABQ9VEU8_SAGOE|nr:A disintegrin and metalloproteinase with thrombospondin motifs 7 [Saguinus oedipus]